MSDAYVPDQPDRVEWDAMVIGTGMGGATAGYELASAGNRVLFIDNLFVVDASLFPSRGGGYESQFHHCGEGAAGGGRDGPVVEGEMTHGFTDFAGAACGRHSAVDKLARLSNELARIAR